MPVGKGITKDNVAELTQSSAYIRLPVDRPARRNRLQDMAREVVRQIAGTIEPPRKLLNALRKVTSKRRIALWRPSPTEQKLFEETPLVHSLPNDPTPYSGIVINDLGGKKLDNYLRREIECVADGCDGETRMLTVTIQLKHTSSDPPLPNYIVGTGGPISEILIDVPEGTMLPSARLLATSNATVVSALANGRRTLYFTNTDRGRPSFVVQIALPPGQPEELVFRLSETAATPGAPRVPIQPFSGPCHSEDIGTRMLGNLRRSRSRMVEHCEHSLCLPLLPAESYGENMHGILLLNATSDGGAQG